MNDAVRPLPQPSPLTQPFWDSARERELVHPRCDACAHAFFPPQVCCPRCRAEEWSWVRSAGSGRLYSHTVVHRAPQPGFDPPYVLGVVDLDEGFELMTNIVGIAPDRVRIGMPVRVEWLEVGSWVLPVFTPTDEMKEIP